MSPLTGRLLWHQLHRFAEALPESPWTDDTRDAVCAFLHAWEAAIEEASHGTCACASHWTRLKLEMPPDLTSRLAFIRWTIDAHNAVNALLGRPLFVP